MEKTRGKKSRATLPLRTNISNVSLLSPKLMKNDAMFR
jgi:hypothetical protein